MTSGQIKLYDLFRKELNLSDDKAAEFVTAVEGVVEQEFKNEKQALSTKEDIGDLRDSIHSLELKNEKQALSSKEDIRILREDLKDNIHSLELKIEQSKEDIYKAMFVSGIVQLLAILGGVLAIFKFMK